MKAHEEIAQKDFFIKDVDQTLSTYRLKVIALEASIASHESEAGILEISLESTRQMKDQY